MDFPEPPFPNINKADRTPLIDGLLDFIGWQGRKIDSLEEEILKMKKETLKPKIEPSKMDKGKNYSKNKDDENPPKPGPKRKKTEKLKVDTTVKIEPNSVPIGSKFKGYREVIIQDLIIESFNTCYQLAQYQTPEWKYVSGQLPKHLKGSHFGATLISYIQHQYHHQHVTQPLLLQFLKEIGVDISAGQLNKFITEDIEIFHQEKDQLLKVGLEVSDYIHTDDTTARHKGKR